MAGIDAGMVAVVAGTATGVTGIVLALPVVAPVVGAAAAVYFAYLAWRIATAPPLAGDGAAGDHPTFAAGMLLSFVNPKAYAAMLALFSGFVLLPDRPVADAAVKVAVVMLVIVTVNALWLFAGAGLTRYFRDPRSNRVVNGIFAVLLIASVAFALLY